MWDAVPTDEIAIMGDDLLMRLVVKCREALGAARQNVAVETNLCYLGRELEIRARRWRAHQEFLRNSDI